MDHPCDSVKLSLQGKFFQFSHDDHSTLAYQPWNNPHLNKMSIVYSTSPLDATQTQIWKDMGLSVDIMRFVVDTQNASQMAKQVWQLQFSKKKNCSVILLDNLLHPTIQMVDCDAKISTNRVMCRKKTDTPAVKFLSDFTCPKDTVSPLCLSAHYKEKNGLPKCWKSNVYPIGTDMLNLTRPVLPLLEILVMIQGKMTHISPQSKMHNICLKIVGTYLGSHLLKKSSWHSEKVLCDKASGFYLCWHDRPEMTTENGHAPHSNMFKCVDKTFISSLFLCDGNKDCVFSTDEEFCARTPARVARNCQALKGNKSFSQGQCLLWKDSKGVLRTYSHKIMLDIRVSKSRKETVFEELHSRSPPAENIVFSTFFCNDGQAIPYVFVNDTIPDCLEGEDESEIQGLPSGMPCPDPTMLPCIPGHPKCFKISNLCLNRRHPVHGHLENCRNGAHLAECKHFLCNGNFKCPGYYCVHLSNRCDGIVDCPNGNDEANCASYVCVGKFKCSKTSSCIHMEEICDGVLQCLHKDDESACDIKECWLNCLCLNFAVHCNNFIFTIGNVAPYLYVSISNSDLQRMMLENVNMLKNSLFIHMNMDKIASICPDLFQGLVNLVHLNLNNNEIEEITEACLVNQHNLNQLTLKHNLINVVAENSFKGLSNLVLLDLSFNKLDRFEEHFFSSLLNLSCLVISHNPILSLHASSLSTLFPVLKYIETDDFRICCLERISSVSCTIEPPWPSSCSNIVRNKGLYIMLPILVILTVVLNIFSIVKHIIAIRENTQLSKKTPSSCNTKNIYNMIVIHINTSDMLLCIYLLSIFAVEMSHQDNFSNIERWWRNSAWCFVASFAYIWPSLFSVFSITFLALTRNRMTVSPMKTMFSQKGKVKIILLVGTSVACLIAIGTILAFRFADCKEYLSNTLCLLIGNTGSSVAEKFTSILFVVVKILAALMNIALYAHLIRSLAKHKQKLAMLSSENPKSSGSGKTSVKISIVVQLLVLGMSNVLCWIPEASLNIVSLSQSNYPINALVWVTMVATPLNGVVNPIVFNYKVGKALYKKIKIDLPRT